MSLKFSRSCALALIISALGPTIGLAANSAADVHGADTTAAALRGCPKATDANSLTQQMQSMHEQMAAANTPAQRRALMAEHMKTMQQGMMMMNQMGSSACADTMGSSEMTQTRLNMMTMMMQMMMDRQQMMGGMGQGMGMGMGTGTAPATPGTSNKTPKNPE